jgi:hypothetical protein
MKKLSIFLSVLLSALTFTVSAQWTHLGSAKVHGHADHDEIVVTALEGDFSAIRLAVENEGIHFEKVVVHFGNGKKQELAIRDFIPAGGETRALDLPGRDRVINKVTLYYKGNAATERKGKVVLYGRR